MTSSHKHWWLSAKATPYRLPTDACRVTDNKCTTTSCSDKGKCNNMKINDLYVPPPKRTEEIASTTTKAQETLIVNAKIMLYDTRQHHYIKALIDSGCTTSAIDKDFVEKNKINTKKVANPMPVYNADGTRNRGGDITDYVELYLDIKGHQERISLMVTNIRSHTIFLGHEWLQRHNPAIDWEERKVEFIRCPKDCGKELEPIVGKEERLYYFHADSWFKRLEEEEVWINYVTGTKGNISTNIAAAAEAKKKHKDWQEVIPPCYHQFERVFTKDEFGELPQRRPWDHAIELTPDFKPVDTKIYGLNLDEQRELNLFIEEHIKSGRIREFKTRIREIEFQIKDSGTNGLKAVTKPVLGGSHRVNQLAA